MELDKVDHCVSLLSDSDAGAKHTVDHDVVRSVAVARLELAAGHRLGALDQHDDLQILPPNGVQNDLAGDYVEPKHSANVREWI